MRRDALIWWFVMAGAILTAVLSRLELLRAAIPELGTRGEATLELLSLIVGIAAGVCRMSPLPISTAGRAKAIDRDARRRHAAAHHPR